MKKHTHVKPNWSGWSYSESGAMDSTGKLTGQPRRSRKRTSSKASLETEGKTFIFENIQPIEESKEETEMLKNIIKRSDSPVNPYNKFEYPKTPAQWPEEKMKDLSAVNSIESMECNEFLTSPGDICRCRSSSKHDDGCCKATFERRKDLYDKIKARVSRAVKIRGDIPKLVKALEERGWIQKYESVKTRMAPYVGNVAILESKSKVNINNADGTLNEKALIFLMLRHKPPDFIWDCRNDFVEWDKTLRSHVLLNRFQRSYVYTSKLGMAHIFQDSHWFFEDNVASVQYPRSYNVSSDLKAFITDFRITAAVGLLKWFVWRVEKGESFVDVGIEPIPLARLEFAVERCTDFLADYENDNIDFETVSNEETRDDQWNIFLQDYSNVLHKGNGISSPRDSEDRSRFEKCYLNASDTLTKLKELDPQYELNGMRNVWILKPSDLCCGSGIGIFHNLKDILRKVDSKPKDYYAVQKYIEKPLLIKGTKFDIRLWYLVTNTFPLTIWIFEEALLRFSSKPYTFATYHEAIHICNTAIQEKYANESRRRRRRIELLGNTDDRGTRSLMVKSIRDQEWDCSKLNEYLKTVGYKDEPYYNEIYPKMSQAIILTMLASQEFMDRRRCSFELYGADFMVMDDLSVWLIEINTNPRMNPPSSRITQRLYEGVLESLVKVIMDVPLDDSAETGGFKLAYKQNTSTDFQPYLGPCLFVFGKQMTLHEEYLPEDKERRRKANIRSSLWGKQKRRAFTAPAIIPRRRDPKIVDFIDYLNGNSRCNVAR